ncbi:MAG: hypothetical protein V3V44_01380 [Anaerolineales bacterium]|jgi:hypothetical protein
MDELFSIDFIGGLVAAVLTVMVLSYLIGDNPLFRLATHIFIGVAAGYAGSIALHNILKPGLLDPIIEAGVPGILNGEIFRGSEGVFIVGGWILIGMLLLKVSPATSKWGTLPIVILVGVGAGVVVGGSILGTIIPQSAAAMETLSPGAVVARTGETGFERILNVFILLLGTLSTLLYFHFSTRKTPTGAGNRSPFLEVVAKIGRVFIAITFGTMFAGTLMTAIVALVERVDSIVIFFDKLGGAF